MDSDPSSVALLRRVDEHGFNLPQRNSKSAKICFRVDRFPSLNFQPSTINFGDQSEVSFCSTQSRRNQLKRKGPSRIDSQQLSQLFLRQARLIQDVAQRARADFAVHRHDRSPVTVTGAFLHGNMTAFLTQQHKPRTPQRSNQLAAGHRWQMPAHPLTSMLVR